MLSLHVVEREFENDIIMLPGIRVRAFKDGGVRREGFKNAKIYLPNKKQYR